MTFYNIKQAAALIGRSALTIKRWEREGKIPRAKRDASTNYRIYTDEDIKMIISKMRIGQIIPPVQETLKVRKRKQRSLRKRGGSV